MHCEALQNVAETTGRHRNKMRDLSGERWLRFVARKFFIFFLKSAELCLNHPAAVNGTSMIFFASEAAGIKFQKCSASLGLTNSR